MTAARIVVLGGGGFVGSAIVRGRGAVVMAPPRHELDMADRDQLRAYLRPGDVVINAAGYARATDRSPAGLARFRRDNVEAVGTLADVATERKVAQLIHLSSVAAMGHRAGHDLQEADVAEPRTPYGRSKRDSEVLLNAHAPTLPITILRPTSVFGEGRGLTAMLCRVARLPVIPVPAGGLALVPLSYIGNLVAAVWSTIGCVDCQGRTFIVGDDQSYRLGDVLDGLARRLGRSRPRTVPVPTFALSGIGMVESRLASMRGASPLLDPVRIETLTSSISYSTQAFRVTTGFVPPFSMDEALDRVAAAHRESRSA